MELISDYDFIIDGTDNFPAKFLINDACVIAKKPFPHAVSELPIYPFGKPALPPRVSVKTVGGGQAACL